MGFYLGIFFLVVGSPGSVSVCSVVVQFWFDRRLGVVGNNVCENWLRMSGFVLGLGLNLLVEL